MPAVDGIANREVGENGNTQHERVSGEERD
jgi:hypothetical protein